MSPVSLAHSIVQSREAAETRNLYVLHGIYGRGRNWGAIARQVVDRRPDWRALLVDLRAHGDSDVHEPPHTVAAAAADVARLASVTGAPVHAILGHSFGGKVALQYASREPEGLKQVWVIDSTPAPKEADGGAWRLLEIVRRHPGPFAARQEAIDALVHEGAAPATAQWMATNVVWDDGRYRWRLDFGVMEALLVDFFRTDLWGVIEDPPAGLMIHLVKANDSSLLTAAASARIGQAASAHRRVQLHRVDGGHWLNTDNPDALVELLSKNLPQLSVRHSGRG